MSQLQARRIRPHVCYFFLGSWGSESERSRRPHPDLFKVWLALRQPWLVPSSAILPSATRDVPRRAMRASHDATWSFKVLVSIGP